MLFISEIGLNYNSVFSNCEKLIKMSKWAGADIAKFQLGWKGNVGEINHLDYDKISQLFDWCDKYEIEIMFSIFNFESLELIRKFPIKRFKIASRTLIDNLDLCKKIISLNLETFISLGMWANKEELPFSDDNIRYLWCKSNYPTDNDDLKLLPKSFFDKKIIGYSDHSIGIESALIAITRGAKIIEKHFTLDKRSDFIRDHALSAEPEDFKILTSLGREISKKINHGI